MNYAKVSIGLALAIIIQFPSIGQEFKNYVEFGPKLLVNQYEVSNADYKLFLNDIAEDISEDQLEALKVNIGPLLRRTLLMQSRVLKNTNWYCIASLDLNCTFRQIINSTH